MADSNDIKMFLVQFNMLIIIAAFSITHFITSLTESSWLKVITTLIIFGAFATYSVKINRDFSFVFDKY